MLVGDIPLIDTPPEVARDLIADIEHFEANNPRNVQVRIGPSEIGMVCWRRLARKLLFSMSADPHWAEPEQREHWLATIGVAVHAWLADRFETIEGGRFLVEQEVTVGEIGGIPITGHSDLFVTDSLVVVDWKVVGDSRLDTYRRRGPGSQYRVQAHLYARGFVALGYPVRHVMIVFLPRNRALGTYRGGNWYAWHEPYDESVALAGLARANGLLELARSVPWSVIEQIYPPCEDEWCPVCPTRHPFGARDRNKLPSMREAIAAK